MDLKQIRKDKNLSQAEVSKTLNIPLRTYKRYEKDLSKDNYKYNFLCKAVQELSAKKKGKNEQLNIAISGIGYVGLSLGLLLADHNNVTLVDVDENKIDLINKKQSPINDEEIKKYLTKDLSIKAKISSVEAYKNQDIIIIAVPTDYDENTQYFNTTAVYNVLSLIEKAHSKALIVIKSTIPVGFTKEVKNTYKDLHIIFSPEFLREGHSIYDNLYPSRIIIGDDEISNKSKKFASLLQSHALNNPDIIFMKSDEAEATKLFSNAYLAMRVAYFNELDTYANEHGLSSKHIIEGMGKDQRIGDYYNNPSFGYGGYCLPKDSAQLRSSFIGIANNNIIEAIVKSNHSRKEYIVNDIIKEAKKRINKSKEDITIGVYKLAMKSNSDNHRYSASLDIYYLLKEKGINVIVYDEQFPDSIKDFEKFIRLSDLIICNRYESKLEKYREKLYTRDIYNRD